MQNFKYKLDKSSKKFKCPGCLKKTFVRFIDIEGSYTSDSMGRCDREVNCGYFVKPDNPGGQFVQIIKIPEKPISYIPNTDIIPTLKDYQLNPFACWLVRLFGDRKAQELILKYRFGLDDGLNTKDWTIFWQFDFQNRVRSGKLIKYKSDGRRDKESAATWFHKRVRNNVPAYPDFNLKQCLFGEHLINTSNKPIAIVESEKTAIIASIYIDKYIWLACGGKSELRAEKVNVLKNRSVTLFPDLGAYEDWAIKAEDFGFNISGELEKIATDQDRLKGLDLADYLLK